MSAEPWPLKNCLPISSLKKEGWKSLFILFILFVFFLLAGCSTKNETLPLYQNEKQILRLNLHSEPASLDPRLARDIPSLTTGKMFFDGLTRRALDGTLQLSVAEKVFFSEDNKSVTFILRSTYWSDGTPVTAYDFEASWKRVLSPDYPAENAHHLFVIKNGRLAKNGEVSLSEIGVYALNEFTLLVELESPNPYFLDLLASPISFPVSSNAETKNPQWSTLQGEEFICNGPFCLQQWEHGSELSAKKNPLYWDVDQVHLEKIILTMIEDEHTELNMYENGELDWAGSPNSSIPPEAIPYLRDCNELHIQPIASTYCFKFNTGAPPFDSVKMRKAFAYAINRQSLIDNVLQANQQVAQSLLPPCVFPHSHSSSLVTNREKAVALFEEALRENGWTRETLPPIVLIFSKSEKHQKTAQAIQQQWCHTFGIKIALQSYEWNSFLEHLSKHNFQIGGKGWVSDISDPLSFLEVYKFAHDSSLAANNETQWEDKLFIELLDQATSTADVEERSHLIAEAERLLMEQMPIAPLYHSTACYLKKSYVHNVYLSELCDLDFKYAFIRREQ